MLQRFNNVSWSAVFRASLYFFIPLCASLGKQLTEFADKRENPFWIKWIVILLTALVPALVAVRAYYDGSAATLKLEKEKKNEINPPAH